MKVRKRTRSCCTTDKIVTLQVMFAVHIQTGELYMARECILRQLFYGYHSYGAANITSIADASATSHLDPTGFRRWPLGTVPYTI